MEDEDKEQYAGIEASHESVMDFLMNELPEKDREKLQHDEVEEDMEEFPVEEPIEEFPVEEPIEEVPVEEPIEETPEDEEEE